MSLVNNSANNFKDFLDAIKPYLNYQFYDLSGQGVEANNFSTDEKVIGTWIDGKPLYQKTVDCGALPNNTTKAISISSLNADKIISYSGMASKTGYYRCLPFSGETINNNIRVDISNGSLTIYTMSDWSTYSGYVTLRYTKTTDTAVSSGEKIVGQWIDGKPVYQKTIITKTPTNVGTLFLSIGVSVDCALDINAIFNDGEGHWFSPETHSLGDISKLCRIAVFANNSLENPNKIRIDTTEALWTNKDLYITLRYTKTT